MERERFAEAEEFLRACLTSQAELLEEGDWRIANARSVLGETLLGQDRFAEAEPLLIEAYETMHAPTPARIRKQALERIVKLYEAWKAAEPREGHDAQAAEWGKPSPRGRFGRPSTFWTSAAGPARLN